MTGWKLWLGLPSFTLSEWVRGLLLTAAFFALFFLGGEWQ